MLEQLKPTACDHKSSLVVLAVHDLTLRLWALQPNLRRMYKQRECTYVSVSMFVCVHDIPSISMEFFLPIPPSLSPFPNPLVRSSQFTCVRAFIFFLSIYTKQTGHVMADVPTHSKWLQQTGHLCTTLLLNQGDLTTARSVQASFPVPRFFNF